MVLAATGAVLADGARVGGTFFPKPPDGGTRRFSGVAFDGANNAYLVVWGLGQVGARFVSASGAPLGSPVALNTITGGAARVACGDAINACLVTWIQEPLTIMGRLVRYNGGAVQFVTNPFVVSQSANSKLSSSAPGVAYSSAANEFLVGWTEFSPTTNIKGQRVSAGGALVGGEIVIAATSLWEGLPSLTYNSVQDEYLIVYYFESSTGVNNVGAQRVKPGTGALINGRNTLATSSFDQYPEVAYNSSTNQYLAITWGYSGNAWMLRGRLADGNAASVGSTSLPLAVNGGGDGIGLAYNPVSNTFLAVYLSQTNDEIWGTEITSNGVATTQFQVTVSGTTLATQPRAAGSSTSGRWLTVASEGFKQVMGQLVTNVAGSPTTGCTTASPGTGWTCVNGTWVAPPPPTSSCTTVQPASNWTCVNGNWLPPTTTPPPTGCTTPSPGTGWTCVNGGWLPPTSTGSCTTVKPGPTWTCVNGNWLPPTTTPTGCTTPSPGTGWTCVNGGWLPPTSTPPSTSSCTTVKPASDWVCVNGNWLPPGMAPPTTSSCTTVSPGPGWTCVSGNWLPPTTSTSSCTTVKPGTNWTCVNGNWLPPGM